MEAKHKFQNPEGSKELYTEISEYITKLISNNQAVIFGLSEAEFPKQYDDMISEIVSDVDHCWDTKFEHIRKIISIYVVQEVIQDFVEITCGYDRTWLQTNYNEYAAVHWENMNSEVLNSIIDKLLVINPMFLSDVLKSME